VDSYYAQFLNRKESAAERAFWVDQLLSGVSENAVIQQSLTSPEFLAANNSSQMAFLDSLYGDVLGRTASTSELAFWQSAMASGMSQQSIVQSFLQSPEAATGVVQGAYQAFLNRVGESNGVNFWTNGLSSGSLTNDTMLAQILSSAEYLQDVQA
jgi:hypothetical protein